MESRSNVPLMQSQGLLGRLGDFQRSFHWFGDMPPEDLHNMGPGKARLLTIDAIEDGRNNFVVTLVASSGFFTDSYILFATNAILPMLDFVYWGKRQSPSYEVTINCATLLGCMVGMVAFGILGDKFGRRKIYGIELLILIAGTFGLVMSSPGYVSVEQMQKYQNDFDIDWNQVGSMNVLAWLVFWRFVAGVGIGGDYPLSAVLVSEMAPRKERGRMLAWVFSMQAFGYAAASITAIVVVSIVRSIHPTASQLAVDQIWRWVMGWSLLFASIAVVMRLFVPESPRFTFDILNFPSKVLQDADTLNQAGVRARHTKEHEDRAIRNYVHGVGRAESSSSSTQLEEFEMREPTSVAARRKGNAISVASFWKYLWKDGHGWKLLVTASVWFMLDFAFFGLGFNLPQTMSKLWQGLLPIASSAAPPLWDVGYTSNQTDYFSSNATDPLRPDIYAILIEDNWHSLATSSSGAILGAVLLICVIKHWNRKALQYVCFGFLAALFLTIGLSYAHTINNYRGVTITLYALGQLLFYLGPNALTFLTAAEIFPTQFRCTCHGISAATGKLGSIVVQLILAFSHVPGGCQEPCEYNPDIPCKVRCTITGPRATRLGYILLIFMFPMLIGMGITWKWLPELQETKGPDKGESKSLEDLAQEGGKVRRPLTTVQTPQEA